MTRPAHDIAAKIEGLCARLREADDDFMGNKYRAGSPEWLTASDAFYKAKREMEMHAPALLPLAAAALRARPDREHIAALEATLAASEASRARLAEVARAAEYAVKVLDHYPERLDDALDALQPGDLA